jgi:hypothetical protein
MKKNLLTLTLSLLTGAAFGQNFYEITFEGTGNNENDITQFYHSIYRDTVSNPDNSWQIGSPDKPVFTGAYSVPNAIVTDTVNPYPVNDTSAFIIKNMGNGDGFQYHHTVSLQGSYFVDSDSLTDFGTIEFSPDNGNTWIDLLGAEYEENIDWMYGKPVLTGNSSGWQTFGWNISQLSMVMEIGDTILYRFSFISDGVQTNRDGLMFDNLRMQDYVEGIEEIQNDNLIVVYPNPVADCLSIESINPGRTAAVTIRNETSQLIYDNPVFNQSTIDTGTLSNGVYFLEYREANSFCIKKLIICHD